MKNKGDKTMKKVLLTSAVALAAFGAVQAVSADTNNGYTESGVVNPETGRLDVKKYEGNKVVSEHTGVVDPANQYKPATPAYNPYHGKPVQFGNGSHVRFHVRDLQGAAVAGVKVDVMIWANQADYNNYAKASVVSAESNAAGDVELAVPHGGLVQYRVAYVPKGYVVRNVAMDQAGKVQVNGKDSYTVTGYTSEDSYGLTDSKGRNHATADNAGSLYEGTFVYSGSADLDKDTHADMFTNASVDLVLEKTDSYNVVKDQWVQEEAGWKYYASNQAVSGWKQVDGKWFFFNAEGVMQKWWVKDGNTWYYLNGNGEMQTGWLQDGGKWYYLENSGAMKASQWFTVGGKWYYVDGSGALAVNTTVGGYTVNGNGEWVK